MDEEHIVAQMRTTISAGYETVSAVVSVGSLFQFLTTLAKPQNQWLLYELARNADIQRELREEVANATDPTLDALNNQYPLLDAVLKETLRLHPAILENHHEVHKFSHQPCPSTTLNLLYLHRPVRRSASPFLSQYPERPTRTSLSRKAR